MIVIGIDAANWRIIKPNLDKLPNFKALMQEGKHGPINLKIKPLSAISWCSMFSGKTPEEHKHTNFIEEGEVKEREDIPVDFVWDKISDMGYKVKALNIPFVYPPYNYNCNFTPEKYGLGLSEPELKQQNKKLSKKAIQIAKKGDYDLFIVVFTALDKLQHFHWGEMDFLVKWYRKMDSILGKVIKEEKKRDGKILVVSDHGFCSFDEAKVQTLPKETKSGKKLKGDHSREAIYIQKNIGKEPTSIPEIHDVILNEFEKK